MPREAAGAGPEDDLAQPRGRRRAGAGPGQRWQLLHQPNVLQLFLLHNSNYFIGFPDDTFRKCKETIRT